MSANRPILSLTMGDPGSIGPEIVVRTVSNWNFEAVPVVIGDKKVLEWAQAITHCSISWQSFDEPASHDGPYLIDLNNVDESSFQWGKIAAHSGQCSFEYIQKAIELALSDQVHAVVTAPISKEALHMAGVPYIGHTEIFKDLTYSTDALTMFQVNQLRVFFLTRHLSIAEAVKAVERNIILSFLLKMDRYLKSIGLVHARIAVAALNPHGGENGLLGREEIEEIEPAVNQACAAGVDVAGIYPADSIFWFAHQGRFDAVLSLYHDQGHIATKCIDFYGTVSVTLGLPFIRTSPDHGTAFDIAGEGIANPRSMLESCRWATEYALAYQEFVKGKGIKL